MKAEPKCTCTEDDDGHNPDCPWFRWRVSNAASLAEKEAAAEPPAATGEMPVCPTCQHNKQVKRMECPDLATAEFYCIGGENCSGTSFDAPQQPATDAGREHWVDGNIHALVSWMAYKLGGFNASPGESVGRMAFDINNKSTEELAAYLIKTITEDEAKKHASAYERIGKQEIELAELRRDRKRLSWVDKQCRRNSVSFSYFDDGDEAPYTCNGKDGMTVREAIDNAMKGGA